VIATAGNKAVTNMIRTCNEYQPDGTSRDVTAFGIPDALANIVLTNLVQETKRLSPHSYAYHPDKNVFDAILALQDFDKMANFFAVQIDFRNADNTSANYLKKKISIVLPLV
jgi:hypothetical protein